MKIAINAMILGRRETGVQVWTRGLIRALARADRQNEYVVYHPRRAAPDVAGAPESFRLVAVGVPGGSRAARIAWERLVLPREVRREGADVLHCPAYVAPRPPRRASGSGRVPTVVTLHDLFVYTHPQFCRTLNILHYRLVMPSSVRRAARIHCTSHWNRMALCAVFPDVLDRVRVVHPAVDEVFHPAAPEAVEQFRRDRGLDAAPFLFVGNVEPKKNVSSLLEAVAIAKRRGILKRKLVLVGPKGWPGVALEGKIARLGLKEDVVRWGYVPREELPLVYGCGRALIFPSRVEGFGLPPLEAMACGTPVVATERGGLAESVGGAALLVENGTPTELAEAIARLEASDELCRALSEVGLRRARQFRWDRAARQMLEVYREAAGA